MATETARYDIVLGFKADVEAAKKQLYDLKQNIDQITSRDFSVNFNNKSIKAGLDQTSKQLITFNKLLNNSMNLDTGKLNLNKLIADTKAYNIDINVLTDNLMGMGQAGEKALDNITTLIANGDTKAISLNKSIQRMGEQLARTAKIQLSYAVLDQFTSVFRDSYNYAQELNESLNNIRIVTNKSKTDMSKFAIEANKAAKALSTTTTAYTDAALIYYQQGLSDKAVKERTDATVKLANATGQSASEVSSYMTAIWNNYDNGSKSLEYYADVITALGAATASSSEEIAQGLSQFSAVANTVGLSYEYASSALATVVAQTRLSADTVGTSFKTIFARLQSLNLGETLDDDTTLTKYTKAMDKVGVSIKNQDGTLKSMDAILDNLGTKWSKLNQEQKNGLAYTVAGARQYTNFIALMDNWQKMQANVNIAEMSEGTLTRQQKIYEESWEAANKRLKASFESIYDTIINDDAFIFLTDSLSKLLELVNQVTKGFGGFEGTLGILTSTAVKLFKPSLNSWISGVINSISQAYSMAGGEADQLQKKFQDIAYTGSRYWDKNGDETELSKSYTANAQALELRRLQALQDDKDNLYVKAETKRQYDKSQKELVASFDIQRELNKLEELDGKKLDKEDNLSFREKYNNALNELISSQAIFKKYDSDRNNLSNNEIKQWGEQIVKLNTDYESAFNKAKETNSRNAYIDFIEEVKKGRDVYSTANDLIGQAQKQRDAFEAASKLDTVQGTKQADILKKEIATKDEEISYLRSFFNTEEEPSIPEETKKETQIDILQNIVNLLQQIADNISNPIKNDKTNIAGTKENKPIETKAKEDKAVEGDTGEDKPTKGRKTGQKKKEASTENETEIFSTEEDTTEKDSSKKGTVKKGDKDNSSENTDTEKDKTIITDGNNNEDKKLSAEENEIKIPNIKDSENKNQDLNDNKVEIPKDKPKRGRKPKTDNTEKSTSEISSSEDNQNKKKSKDSKHKKNNTKNSQTETANTETDTTKKGSRSNKKQKNIIQEDKKEVSDIEDNQTKKKSRGSKPKASISEDSSIETTDAGEVKPKKRGRRKKSNVEDNTAETLDNKTDKPEAINDTTNSIETAKVTDNEIKISSISADEIKAPEMEVGDFTATTSDIPKEKDVADKIETSDIKEITEPKETKEEDHGNLKEIKETGVNESKKTEETETKSQNDNKLTKNEIDFIYERTETNFLKRLNKLDPNNEDKELINDILTKHPNSIDTDDDDNWVLKDTNSIIDKNTGFYTEDFYNNYDARLTKAADAADQRYQDAENQLRAKVKDDSTPANKYDELADSITKVIDLTGSMISLNSTLKNTFSDLQNGDFSNLLGNLSALGLSLGNAYNTVSKLRDSMSEEEWGKLTHPLKGAFDKLKGSLKDTKKESDNLNKNINKTGTEAVKTGATGSAAMGQLTAGEKGADVAGKSLKNTLSGILGPMIAIQAAMFVLQWVIEQIKKYIEDNDPRKKLERLQEATENLKDKANEAAEAYENLSSILDGLDTASDKIKNLTDHTLEWKNAVADNNKQVLELLESYDMLSSEYLDTSEGYYQISEAGKRELQNRSYQEKQSTNSLYLMSLARTKTEEYRQEEKDTNTKNAFQFAKEVELPTKTTTQYSTGAIDVASGNPQMHQDIELAKANELSDYYQTIKTALSKQEDSQFRDIEEFTQAMLAEGIDINTDSFAALSEELFPDGKKAEILTALEEEQISRDKNTEAINLLTKEAGKNLFEEEFAKRGISEEVWNDEEFQQFYQDKLNQAQEEVGTGADWDSKDKKKEVSELFGTSSVGFDEDRGIWTIDKKEYTTEEVALKAQQDKVFEDPEIIAKAKEVQAARGFTIPAETLNDSTNGTIAKDKETWKLDTKNIDAATEALYKMYEAQGMTEEEAERIVVANEKLNAAYSDLISNFENYNTALKNNEKYSAEYQNAMAALKKDVAAISDINADLINEDFLANEENLKLLEKFQYGDMAAGEEFRKRLSYNLDLDISDETKNKITSQLDAFYEETKNTPLEMGMTLDSTEALQGMANLYQKMLESGEMTADQVSAALSAIGFEPDIEWQEVKASYLQSINYSGAVKLRTGDKEQDVSDFTSLADIDGEQMVKYPVIKPKGSRYRGKTTNIVSGANKQKAAKNAASNKPKTKKVDDEKKRYYEINQELAKLNDELNKITKAKDRAFGKEKLGYLDQEINKYKDLEKAQQKYLDEVNSYLSKDMGTLAAYGAQFNDDGTLANYEELISKQVAQYNATANAENSNADEVYSNFTKALSNYEDSLSKSREVLNQLIDYQNQIYDLKLEKIVYKVEYKVEINDKDLERLEWLLSNISDKAFKSAESIALMSKQMADYKSSFETVNKGIDEWFANHTEISAEMKDAFLNGTLSADELASKLNTLTEAEKEQLYNWSSQLMQLVDNMEQVKQAIQDQLLKSFDDLTEKVDEQVNRLDTLNQIMSSYIEIAKLVGKENLGVSDELMKQMRQSTINLSTQQVNILRKEYEAAKEELDKLLSTPGVDQETINQAKQKVSEIYANLLSQTQNTVSAIQQMFADTMQDIANDFSKKMGGVYGSISELQLAYDRQKNLNDGYLETYQKSYELAKLTREINNSINDTDSLKGKQLLLSLEDEITQRQADRTKMSEYELNFLQKKYELYQAQIALEEAQNAKSQVRMTRDANGNMSYTYTADQEAIDKAEQGYNDALYNLMNLNQEQLQANQEKILSIVSEYYQNLIDLGYDQEEAAALANEHYQTLMAQAREEMDLTLGHASWIVEEMGVKEDLLIDKFDETVLAHITGTTTMEEYIDNWEAAVAAAISATNTNYQEFQSNLTSCLEVAELNSGAFAEAVDADMSEVNDALIETENETDKLVDTFKSDFDKALGYVKDFDNKYAKFLENMRQNTNTLVEALNNLIKGFAELDGRAANVISTSQSKISAAEAELETQSNGSGTPKEQGGGGADEYTFYFGNEPLGKGKLTEKNKFYGQLASMTGIPQINGAHYITTYPAGYYYVYTNMDGTKHISKKDPYSDPDARLHDVQKFDTGGYTGDWSSNDGKLAVLHQKELVLNADDTSNILEVVNIVRNLADTISNLTYRDKMESLLNNIRNIYDHIYDNIKIENSQNMDQYVTIQADFPSVSSQVEIEAAFDNILLHASQYANRKA